MEIWDHDDKNFRSCRNCRWGGLGLTNQGMYLYLTLQNFYFP